MSFRLNLYLLAIGSILVWNGLAADTMSANGIMQVIKKSVLAKDMIHIIRTIYQNAKFWDYPDIKDEIGSGLFKKGLYITDIDISTVEFNSKPLVNALVFSPASKRATFYTKEPLLKYNFVFKWRAEAFGIHLAVGTGNVTMTSKLLDVKYSILNEASSMNSVFSIEVTAVQGPTNLLPNIADWIAVKMGVNVYPALLKGIEHNVHFLDEHTHIAMRKITKRLGENHYIDYIAAPNDAAQVGDYLMYAFNMSLKLDDKDFAIVDSKFDVAAAPIAHDIGIFVAPVLSALTIRAHGSLRSCEEFDMKTIGLTGTVKDLFTPIPELTTTYTGSEALKMYCMYGEGGVKIEEKNVVTIPARCNFTLISTGALLLSTRVEFKMNYEPAVTADNNKLFGAKLSNVAPQGYWSSPRSADVSVFLMRLFHDMAKVRYEGRIASVPGIRYEPYRGFSTFSAELQNGLYVSYYDDLIE